MLVIDCSKGLMIVCRGNIYSVMMFIGKDLEDGDMVGA